MLSATDCQLIGLQQAPPLFVGKVFRLNSQGRNERSGTGLISI